jgi:predicted nucleotidyltransferase
MRSTRLPPDVAPLLNSLLHAIRDALDDNFAGAYLFGSLATGDFNEASDIDVLVITERPASEEEFAALKAVHERIRPSDNVSGHEYEVFYVDRETIRRPAPGATQMRSDPDEALRWEKQRKNFVIERRVLRERGVTLVGPEPKTLIDPVSAEEIGDAVRSERGIRIADWGGGGPVPAWLRPRYFQVYEIETVCRALCTLQTGELTSKSHAIAWALESLPADWHSLIRWSMEHRSDLTEDETLVPEVVRFVRYAAERASISAE